MHQTPEVNSHGSAEQESQAVVAAETNADALCIHCEYPMRGLPTDGRCPECGQLISDSLVPGLIRSAPRRWTRRLAWGALLSATGSTMMPLIWIFTSVIPIYDHFLRDLIQVTLGIGLILDLWGALWFTHGVPPGWHDQRMDLRRVVARSLAVAFAIAFVSYSIARRAHHRDLTFYLVFVQFAALLGCRWMVLHYARHLAMRVPDVRLEGRLRATQQIILVALLGLFPVGYCIGMMFSWDRPSPTALVILCLAMAMLLSYSLAMAALWRRLHRHSSSTT